MEEIKYNKLIRIDKDNNIIDSKTDGIIKEIDEWLIIGETEDRHWHLDLVNSQGILCKKYIDGEIIERPQVEIDIEIVAMELVSFFARSDMEFIRVIEDLIDTLISKNIISIDDLPNGAKEKYNNRKAKR